MLGLNALSDGALALQTDDGPLLTDISAGWNGKVLPGPDLHLLSFLDDVASVMAIQVRPTNPPVLAGRGTALDLLERYEGLVAAENEEVDDLPGEVLAVGDYLVARSVYLPGDTRLLVMDRGDHVELACEGAAGFAGRDEFLNELRECTERFFLEMRSRTENVSSLAQHPGFVPAPELLRQGQQWQRRVEALLLRSVGEKFAPLVWPW